MRKFSVCFLRDQSGTTKIEYIIIASLVGLVLFGVLDTIGLQVTEFFTGVPETIDGSD